VKVVLLKRAADCASEFAESPSRSPENPKSAIAQGALLAFSALIAISSSRLIWKTLLIAEKTFRRLDAPELLADVASDVMYVNGVRATNRREKKAAA